MGMGRESLQECISKQRKSLADLLRDPLRSLAADCGTVWGDAAGLDATLAAAFPSIPHCKFLYVLDARAVQVSANMSREGLLEEHRGRDRADRPYMREAVPPAGFLLSEAYISLRARRPSLTAIQAIVDGAGGTIGYVGADFALRELPHTRLVYEEPRHWRQQKGDPSIRGTVFAQTRTESVVDRNADTVVSVIEELMRERGVFHVVLHLAASQAAVWLLSDPLRYRLLGADALIDPDSCMAYPRRRYPENALVPARRIRAILENFRALRAMDDVLYLRSGTINIFNGLVGLTFSCDGSHTVHYEEFLAMNADFWLDGGALGSAGPDDTCPADSRIR